MDQPRWFGIEHERCELLIVLRVRRIEAVLLAKRDDHFVDERHAETRHPNPILLVVIPIAIMAVLGPTVVDRMIVIDSEASTQRRGIDADNRIRVRGVGARAAVVRQQGLRHLQRDRMGVQSLESIDARGGRQRNQVGRIERPEAEQVEDGPEIHKERVVALAGEHLRAVGQGVDSRIRERLVSRCGTHADIDRRRGQASAEYRAAVPIDPRHRVCLPDVEVRIVQ